MADQLLVNDPTPGASSKSVPDHPLAEMASKLYDGNASARLVPGNRLLTQTIDRAAVELFEAAGASEAQREGLQNDFVDIHRETGLPDGVVMKLAEAFISGEAAAARAEDPDARLVDIDKRCLASNEELRLEMRQRLGATGAEDLLSRVQKFARANPKLQKVLQSHGIGSRAEIVQAIADHVFSTGYR